MSGKNLKRPPLPIPHQKICRSFRPDQRRFGIGAVTARRSVGSAACNASVGSGKKSGQLVFRHKDQAFALYLGLLSACKRMSDGQHRGPFRPFAAVLKPVPCGGSEESFVGFL